MKDYLVETVTTGFFSGTLKAAKLNAALNKRKPDKIELGDRQVIVPIPAGADQHSLSAILLDGDYYTLIRNHSVTQEGLPFATVTALIPLKARAWSDLSQRKAAGEHIDSKTIAKHRNDVFRLAATLPGEPGPESPDSIVADLNKFLGKFPADSPEWAGIQASLEHTVASGLKPAVLCQAIQTYFRLPLT